MWPKEAADFENRQATGAACPEPPEERIEVERRAQLLEREVQRGAIALPRDEHLDHALAVSRVGWYVRPSIVSTRRSPRSSML